MAKPICVITSFRFDTNKHGEQVVDKGRSTWCSSKKKALDFIKNANWMEHFVEHFWSYVVIEEIREFSGNSNIVGWYRAKYSNKRFYPTIVSVECPIEGYDESHDSVCGLIT